MVDDPPRGENWIHEIKYDGYRLQPHIQNKKVKIYTRNGNDWSEKFSQLAHIFSKLKIDSAVFDGEAVVMDDLGRSHFGELQNALSIGDQSRIKIFIFDLLYLNGIDQRNLPLKSRKEKLKKLIPKNQNSIFFSEEIKSEGLAFFKKSCRYGLEGIVSKEKDAVYTTGRSRAWCKTKCGLRQEFVIGGYSEGKGNRKNEIGALLLGIFEHNKLRFVGKVGSGFNSKNLIEIKNKVSKLEQAKSSFNIKSPNGRGIHWIRPILVAEISFANWTNDKSVRNGVFLGLREDKESKEIVMEKMEIELTHPEKILFNKEKISKKMIADYYHKVASYMLPFIDNRPLSLFRCPNGVTKKCFYQKHPPQGSTLVNFKNFKVKEKSNTNIYLALDSEMGLLELVQMNAFEVHTWNCRYQNLIHPDQIVLDFDPDTNVPFHEVVNACFEMKKILEKLKLKSFIKLTGGKGVHIHIPIEPNYTWEEIKAFSKALADEMVDRFPDKFLATMSKELRKGKIFIDYLRNAYGATAVAPYALRAKEKSSVALPIAWGELKKIKSSDQFTFKKALLKIKNRKSDPWKNFLKTKQLISILE